MPEYLRCPECDRLHRYDSPRNRKTRCPFCKVVLDPDEMEDDDPRSRRRRSRPSNSNTLLFVGLAGLAVFALLLVIGVFGIWWFVARSSSSLSTVDIPEQTEDYAQARQHFQTQLTRQGPAPQQWQTEKPLPGVREVPYQSGNLRLHAWVNAPQAAGGRRPAVLFLHGGFAFGADDWEQTQPFRDAGFVVMTPTLRGENGLPGSYSMFYNEVEDVLAAAETLAKLPYVDSNRIYVAGHSVGGTLTMLAAMTSPRFRAAASFSGSPDQVSWTRMQSFLMVPRMAPFNRDDPREFQMRSPLAFYRSFKCPVRIYYGSQEGFFAGNSQKLAQLAKGAGLDVEATSVPGDHMSMAEPAMRQAIAFFRNK